MHYPFPARVVALGEPSSQVIALPAERRGPADFALHSAAGAMVPSPILGGGAPRKGLVAGGAALSGGAPQVSIAERATGETEELVPCAAGAHLLPAVPSSPAGPRGLLGQELQVLGPGGRASSVGVQHDQFAARRHCEVVVRGIAEEEDDEEEEDEGHGGPVGPP